MPKDIFDPEYDAVRRRRAFAEYMLKQGMESGPVGHPLAAVARALQGAMGGYQAGQADKEARELIAKDRDLYTNLPGLPGSSAGPGGGADLSPSPGPTPEQVRATAERYGVDPETVAGLYANPETRPRPGPPGVQTAGSQYGGMQPHGQVAPDNSVQPMPVENQQAFDAIRRGQGINLHEAMTNNQPMVPQTVQQQPTLKPIQQTAQTILQAQRERSAVNIPPEVGAQIQKLLSNPRTRPQGLALYGQYAKPTDQFDPTMTPDGTPAQRNRLTGEYKALPQGPEASRVVEDMRKNWQNLGFKGPDDPELHALARQKMSGMQTSVAVNTATNPILEAVGKQFAESRQKANSAATSIPMIHEARKLLDEGMVTGAGADPRVMLAKIGALFGMDATEASNSETFRTVVGRQVLDNIKQLGANPSNVDRDYIEKVMGGQIALEERSLRRILEINEKHARDTIRSYKTEAKRLTSSPANRDALRGIAPLLDLEEPGEYKPSRAAIEAEIRRRKLLR